MRVVLIVLLGCIWMPVAWAKTMAFLNLYLPPTG